MEKRKGKMICQMKDETELTVKKNWRRQIGNRHRRKEKSTKQHACRSDWCAHCIIA